MKSARKLLLCATSLTALISYSAHAADGTWTGTNTGTWDVSNSNWTVVGDPAWDATNGPGNKAIFATAGDLATISGTVYTSGITFNQTGSVSNGGNTANSIKYAADGATMAFNVAAGKTGTINANINYGGTGASGDILTLTGGGTLNLSLGATLVANDGVAKTSYFTVNGGSTLNVTGGIMQTMILNGTNRGSSPNAYLGGSSSSNTLNVSGTGKLVTGNFNIGSAGNNDNEVYISAPGTNNTGTTPATDTASWVLHGSSAQLNMNSSNNLVEISNGAFVQVSSTTGTGTWTLGNSAGADGNQIVVTGLGSTVSRGSGSAVNLGGAGPTNHTFGGTGGGSSNAVIVQAGGLWVGGRVGSGIGNGVDATNNNYFLITGTSDGTQTGVPSYYRLNGGSNGHFTVGATNNASTNSFRVEAGARADIFGTGTGKNLGLGFVSGSDNNYVKVSGVGSVLNFITGQELTVGGNASVAGGSGNHVDVYDGGSLIMSNVDNTIPLAASVSWTTWAANPTTSTAMVLAGATSALNIGNGTSNTSLVKIGSVNGHTGVELANATSSLNFNNGRLVAGVAGNLVSGNGAITLNGAGYISTKFASTISTAISGSGTLIKEEIGTLTLTGAAATYSGSATIAQGTLALTTLNPGSGKTLKGNGAVTGVVDMMNGSTFAYEVNSSTVTANLLTVNGTVTLENSGGDKVYLTLDDLALTDVAFATGTKFSLMNYSSTLSGGFFYGATALGEGGMFTAGLNQWTINYGDLTGGINFGGSPGGKFINLTAGALTAIPEPRNLLALGCLVGSGLFLRSRRRRG